MTSIQSSYLYRRYFRVGHRISRKSHKAKGFLLVESMVALAVLSIGIIGLATVQMTASRNNYSAMLRTEAAVYTHAMVEKMRNNIDAVKNGDYNIDSLNVHTGSTSDVPASTKGDIDEWQANLSQAFDADTTATIDCDESNIVRCQLKIRWDDSRGLGINDELESNEELIAALQQYEFILSASFR